MITIEKLSAFGANTTEGLSRCCGSEALYLKLVNMVPDEEAFGRLSRAIGENDRDAAFEAVHALKGVLGNLSLTPMYDVASRLTELLRSRSETDCEPMLVELLKKRDELRELCAG